MQIKYIKEGYFKSYDDLKQPSTPEDKMQNIAKRNRKIMMNIANAAFKKLIDAASDPSARRLFYYRKAGKVLDRYIYVRANTATAPAITKIQCTEIENDDMQTIHVNITVAHKGSVETKNFGWNVERHHSVPVVYTVNAANIQNKEQMLSDISSDISQYLYAFATSVFPGRPITEAADVLKHPLVIDNIIMCSGDSYPVSIVFDETLTAEIDPSDADFSENIESLFNLITDTFTFQCGKDKISIYYWAGEGYGKKYPYRVIK